MWRSSVLLPQPLPPMMTKISPRRDREVEVAHDDEVAVGHRQVAHVDVGVGAVVASPQIRGR